MLAYVFALALASPAKAESPPVCVMEDIDTCDNLWDGAWQRVLERALARFFGKAKADLIAIESPLLAKQIFAAFSGVGIADRPRKLPDGNRFIEGCLAHFCTQEAAAIMTRDGRVLAVALHSHQGDNLTHDLDIFITRRGEHNRPWIRLLARWAVTSPVHSSGLRRVRFHVLDEIGDGRLPA